MMQYFLSASVLNADFSKLGEQIQIIESAGVNCLHLDVMDYHFVPNLSFGTPVIASLRTCTSLFFDVHLMVTHPENYFSFLKKAGVDGVTIHIETVTDLSATIQKMKKFGFRVGVALKPSTSIQALDAILAEVELILVMTVEPGFGGQSLILETLNKVKHLRQKAGNRLDIQVDGGWNESNLHVALSAGANNIVCGSSIFGKPNIAEAVQKIRYQLEQYY